MFNKKKIDIPLPPLPKKAEDQAEDQIVRSTVKQVETGEFDQVMSYMQHLDKKMEILIQNQSKIFDLVHDQSLQLRDQNNRIRELIMNHLVDLPKFDKD